MLGLDPLAVDGDLASQLRFDSSSVGTSTRTLKGEDRMATWKGKLENNEVLLLLVADGHGGAEAAEWCARNTLNDVRLFAGRDASVASFQAACKDAFSKAADEVCRITRKAGSTLTVVCVNATLGEMTCASLGDSAAYLFPYTHGDGKAKLNGNPPAPLRLTSDHRLQSSEEERQRVLTAGAKVAQAAGPDGKPAGPLRAWPGGLAIARTIGDADCGDYICSTPTVKSIRLPRLGASVVVASDGVWDSFQDVEPLTRLVYKNTSRQLSSQLLADAIVAKAVKMRGGLLDDTSCIFVSLLPADAATLPLHMPRADPAPRTNFFMNITGTSSPTRHNDPKMVSEALTGVSLRVALNQPKQVEAFLRTGLDVNAIDIDGDRTPLHWAAARGFRRCVVLLLEAGADTSARNADGLTPAELARELGQPEMHALISGFKAGTGAAAQHSESSIGESTTSRSSSSSINISTSPRSASPTSSSEGSRHGGSYFFAMAVGLGTSLKTSPTAIRRAIGMISPSRVSPSSRSVRSSVRAEEGMTPVESFDTGKPAAERDDSPHRPPRMIVPVDISGRDDSTKILRPTATPAHRPMIMSASVTSTASSLTFSHGHHGHAAAAVAAAANVEEIDEVELS
jgi:serine/threonine protein phosphatase PrpC